MNYKLAIEDTLQRIDNFFKEKPKKDIYMIYIMVAAISFALAYSFYDTSLNKFNTIKERVDNIEAKINADKLYMQINTQEAVAKLYQDIKNLEKEQSAWQNKNIYIKNKIDAISSLIYNEKTWGEYLNSISLNAKKHDMKVIDFKNTYSKKGEASFGHVLDISLKVRGDYLNTLNFINSLEQSSLVVDIHDFSIKAQDTLNTDLNISVWGINYR